MNCADVIAEYFERVNADAWDGFEELWTDDVELRWVGREPMRGKAQVLDYYPKLLARFGSHHDEVTRVVTAGDTVTVEIHFTGETTAGHAVEFDAVDVFDLDDGRIAALSTWYDTATVNRMVRGDAT